MPSNEAIAQFLGALLGGALLGGRLFPSSTMVGALIGAIAGAGVIVLRTRHAH